MEPRRKGKEEKGKGVVIEERVALISEAAACGTLADVRSVQVTGYVESQRSTRNVGARRKKGKKVATVAPGRGGQELVEGGGDDLKAEGGEFGFARGSSRGEHSSRPCVAG